MIERIERWAVRRVTARALARLPVLDKNKILEGLAVEEDTPLVRAVLSIAAGREQEARENCSVQGQTDQDLRFNSGKLADAVEFQEDLIATMREANLRKRGGGGEEVNSE